MLLMISLALQARAQNVIIEPSDTIHKESGEKLMIYTGASYSGQQLKATYASVANISLGLVINQHFDAAISYGVVINDFQSQVIFPSTFNLDQTNWGVKLQYLFTKRALRPVVGLDGIFAQLTWTSQGDFEDTYSDRVFMVNPFVGGVWKAFELVFFQATAGYNFTGDLQLVGFEPDDYNGLRFELAVKIGVFRSK